MKEFSVITRDEGQALPQKETLDFHRQLKRFKIAKFGFKPFLLIILCPFAALLLAILCIFDRKEFMDVIRESFLNKEE